MSQGQLEVILVVENVEEVAVERMDVLYFGEVVEDVSKTFVDCVLTEFYLSGQECTFRI